MNQRRRRIACRLSAARALLCTTLAIAAACSSVPLRIPGAELEAGEVAHGQVTGESTGVMLFQIIPIGQNDRFQEAYERAMLSAPGATRLIDVTIQESWFWAWLLNGYNFKLTGTAVGPADS